MGFCYFSKDFLNGAYTNVENKFIVKYMPQAEDIAVKVYLYGLFLCQNSARDFSVENCSEVLKLPIEKIVEAFEFWEDCDLVQIICRNPFTLEYLPVSASDGRPKRIKYEKYADFNKELQRKMQTVGIFLEYPTLQKYMNFLQANEMEQQAFLLIAEYCIQRSGASVSNTEIFNKARNFIKRGLFTYSQVEKALSDFNVHTADLKRVIAALGGYNRDPDESDYTMFEKWTGEGFETSAVTEAAKSLKRGNMQSLGALLAELKEEEKFTKEAVAEYLAERDMLCNMTFKIARSLGVKISSPLVYNKEYTGKWYNRGYEENVLCSLALFCVKTERNTFSQLDELLEKIYAEGVVSEESVQDYLKNMQKDLKLLTKIQSYCGTVRKTEANLNTLAVWRKWNFSDDMITEAAKRATNTVHPLPYMNKILSDWKRENVFTAAEIPEKHEPTAAPNKAGFVNPAITAMDEKTDRERYYANRRARAEAVAERFKNRALQNPEYKELTARLSETEREAAKAEAFGLSTVDELIKRADELKRKKNAILTDMGITENDFIPQYSCKKCSDSGFLPDGRACKCYKK